MDMGCLILTLIMLTQMSTILYILNPIYDIRKTITFINDKTRDYKTIYYALIATYFLSVVTLGMYVPLHNIYTIIFSIELDDYDKVILLSRVEKNYIIAGFSLFLLVVLYGMRELLIYTANLAFIVEKISKPAGFKNAPNRDLNVENILPKLLRVKRSISKEAFLCTKELQEDLIAMMKNLRYTQYQNIVSRVFEMTNNNQEMGF